MLQNVEPFFYASVYYHANNEVLYLRFFKYKAVKSKYQIIAFDSAQFRNVSNRTFVFFGIDK